MVTFHVLPNDLDSCTTQEQQGEMVILDRITIMAWTRCERCHLCQQRTTITLQGRCLRHNLAGPTVLWSIRFPRGFDLRTFFQLPRTCDLNIRSQVNCKDPKNISWPEDVSWKRNVKRETSPLIKVYKSIKTILLFESPGYLPGWTTFRPTCSLHSTCIP